ncbi:MAG: hypothetical protein QGI86_09310 [Candidatus Poribacteria bacterium]|jgi:hypothetical protein|nr:hypothetical protein [Candidatus Poribacteria bacterium]MDP6748061.1 hypothetical protein [Candidatus Poribacteria bacterium]MDP6999328.1 hypothetical protein [Candidatus Poribacteria bacterium]
MKETIAWDRIEVILRKDYPVGQKKEGNKAHNCNLYRHIAAVQYHPVVQ